MSEIDALRELKDSLSYEFWDTAAYFTLAAVFLGVIGESIVELTSWITSPETRRALGKASALLLIAGLGGEIITYAKNNEINGIIIGFLHKQAGDAYSIGNEARKRANTLAVEVELLQRKNDQFEVDNQLRQKQIDDNQAGLTKSFQQADTKIQGVVSTVRGVEGRERPQEVDDGDLRRATRALKGSLRVVTLIRINDPIAGTYADKIKTALEKQKPKFTVYVENIPSSSFRGVVVCENGKGDRMVGRALKAAGIVSEIKTITAEECKRPIAQPPPPSLTIGVSIPLGPGSPPRHGTVIFVGHRRLPSQ